MVSNPLSSPSLPSITSIFVRDIFSCFLLQSFKISSVADCNSGFYTLSFCIKVITFVAHSKQVVNFYIRCKTKASKYQASTISSSSAITVSKIFRADLSILSSTNCLLVCILNYTDGISLSSFLLFF